MDTQSIPPFHNPNNLTPTQYGASEGWRLLRESELKCIPGDAQFYCSTTDKWEDSCWRGYSAGDGFSYRTRTPDPFAPVDQWVKMSERKPSKEDFPVLFCNIRKPDEGVRLYYGPSEIDWTHWKPFRETPPARELTQAEKDEAAYAKWYATISITSTRDAWNAALAYERARTAAK